LPGHIPGLFSEVQKAADRMRYVRFAHTASNGKPAGLYVTMEVPFEQPETRWQKQYGARGQELRRRKQVPKLARRELYLPVPDRVAGDSYADALAAFEEQRVFWIGVIESASVKACNACGGTGHVPDGSAKYESKS